MTWLIVLAVFIVAVAVTVGSWRRAERTKPLTPTNHELGNAEKDALNRDAFRRGQNSGGFTGGPMP